MPKLYVGNSYKVEVIIGNKPAARDPEGETILNSLMIKGGYRHCKSVRVMKLLRVEMEAEGVDEALKLTKRMCDELRIYNPAAHNCELRLVE